MPSDPKPRSSRLQSERKSKVFARLLWRGDDRSRTGVAGFAGLGVVLRGYQKRSEVLSEGHIGPAKRGFLVGPGGHLLSGRIRRLPVCFFGTVHHFVYHFRRPEGHQNTTEKSEPAKAAQTGRASVLSCSPVISRFLRPPCIVGRQLDGSEPHGFVDRRAPQPPPLSCSAGSVWMSPLKVLATKTPLYSESSPPRAMFPGVSCWQRQGHA